jgi:hypothetical protein
MNGVDPAAERKRDKVMKDEKTANTFEAVAREWFAMHSPRWAESHSGKLIRRLEMYVFPWLCHKPIAEVKPLELLTALRRIESKGVNETAHRALQVCGRVMRYAVVTGRVERDFTRDLAARLRRFESVTLRRSPILRRRCLAPNDRRLQRLLRHQIRAQIGAAGVRPLWRAAHG